MFKLGKEEIIVFIGGTVVMVLELIGSRILAPHLGNSIFVWSSLIGIILAAMSLGYYLGGRLSLKKADLKTLGWIIFGAGVSILLIPLIKNYVLKLLSETDPRFGAIAATIILFALPSMLLGIISPYTIRLKTSDATKSGGTAGNLYALSTIGSIVGTFLAGFYLIPSFTNNQIMFGLSIILVLTSLTTKLDKIKILFLLLIAVSLFLMDTKKDPHLLLETDSVYNHIRVVDFYDKKSQKDSRALMLATEIHSAIYRQSDEIFLKYHKMYRLDSLFNDQIKKGLALGGGGYVTTIDFLKRYPQGEITTIEIDPKVTSVAKDFFNLKDSPRLKIYHEDARMFINHDQNKYDVVYGDAFASYFSIPFQLTTSQAIEKIYNLLDNDGIFILNTISSLQGDRSLFFQAEYKTIKKFFPQIYVFPLTYDEPKTVYDERNIILIATKNPQRLNMDELTKKATPEQMELLREIWPEEVRLDPKIKILDDELAPVDYYISKLL
ncbi:MAG: fused MFS/spermidine synthase [Patescibacteria group bacterium]|nr:fused MFS/spermidine synthase [Patescibacteria group bacterium]